MANNNTAIDNCMNKGLVPGTPEFAACLNLEIAKQNPAPVNPGTTAPASGSATGWQAWVNPQTISTSLQATTTLAGMFQKTPDQKELITACGRRPILGDTTKYDACIANYTMAKSQAGAQMNRMATTQTGMSSGMIAVIALLVIAIVILFIIAAIVIKRNAAGAKK